MFRAYAPASRGASRRAAGSRPVAPPSAGPRQSLAELLEARTLLSASAVDTSFSGDGRFELLVGDRADFHAVTVLPDGKVLAAGTVDMDNDRPFQNDFLVARFTAAGALAWNAALLGAGALLGSQYDRVEGFVGPVSTAVIVVVVLAAIAGLMWLRRRAPAPPL